MNGRHVVVTGASSGIGEALAHAFSRAGARVTLVARREELLRALAAALPGPALPLRADLAQLEGCLDWIPAAEEAHGPVDVLVNNAGVQEVAALLAQDSRREEAMLRLNLLAPLRLIHRLVPPMVARGRGAVVNVSSLAAIVNTPGMAGYSASKAGLAAASETLYAELRGSGVQVLTVYPGPVRTPLEQAARARYGASAAADWLPTGTPEVLARRVVRALARGRRRVVYPRVYGLTRWLPGTSQWLTERLTRVPGPPED